MNSQVEIFVGNMNGVGTNQMHSSSTRMDTAKAVEMITRNSRERAKYDYKDGLGWVASMIINLLRWRWRALSSKIELSKEELYRVVASGDPKIFACYRLNMLQQFAQGNTVLHVAVQHKQKKMAEAILEREPSLLCGSNWDSDTPLHIAARTGCLTIAASLLSGSRIRTSEEVEAGQRLVEMLNKEGDTALHDAINNGHLEVFQFLLESNPQLTLIENQAGESPLFLAVDKGFFDIAGEILQSPGMSPSIKGRDSMNALHAAIIRFGKGRQLNGVKERFLLKGFPNTTEGHLETKIEAIMEKLIKKCPSAMLEVDKFGRTPLHYAAYFGRGEVAELLLKVDNNPGYIADLEGVSALHIAAKNGHVNFIEKLFEYCPDTWALLDKKGMTALHAAVESGQQRVVEYFLEIPRLDCVINRKDEQGNTPLHLAAIHGNPDILVKLTNDRRVDRSAINKEGFTAMDIIRSNTKLTILEKDYLFEWSLCVTGSLPRSLKQEVSRTNAEALHSTGEIDVAGRDGRSIRVGRYMDDIDVVVAILIAAVTFQAALQTPGGYEQNDFHKGMAVLVKQFAFNVFVIADSLAFALASASVFVHFWSFIEESPTVVTNLRRYARFMTNISIAGMVIAFAAGATVVLTPSRLLYTFTVVCCACFFLGPIILFLRIMRTMFKSVFSGTLKKWWSLRRDTENDARRAYVEHIIEGRSPTNLGNV
ncbi:hypothetical protein SO802_029279 [Lithocarpus litseifolius]|uniref:PGG domain-containing protein n=1 Tax=Lithocarpus litseifolius TaxID=425828 RepID=A0AAW2BYE5_9ROSI